MKNNSLGITPTIKNLSIYERAMFPLVKYSVVNSTIQRIQTESNKRFTQKKNKETQNLEVIRTA